MVAENNDMSFFKLFQYSLGSGLGTPSEVLKPQFESLMTYDIRSTPDNSNLQG